MLQDRVRSSSDSRDAQNRAPRPFPGTTAFAATDPERREALRTVLQAALNVEFEAHLSTVDPAHPRRRNSKNGFRSKKLSTDIGVIEIAMPRDRQGTFQPYAIRKRQRSFALGWLLLSQLLTEEPTHANAARVVAMLYPGTASEQLQHTVAETLLALATAWNDHRIEEGAEQHNAMTRQVV